MTTFQKLFSSTTIGRMELRNRLVMSPMETQYATPEGLPSPRTIAYFEERAKGGVGLITTGASCIDPLHKEIPFSHHFGSDDVIESHRALTDAVHAHGAKIQPQIAHAGPDGVAPQMHGIDSLGPSAIQSYLTGTTSREMTRAEFDAILDQYRAAARRVRESGYDGIELHAAHGYMLLGSFLTPWRNNRTDEFDTKRKDGGVYAIKLVLEAIRSEIGDDFPITLRLSGFERIPGGRLSTDSARIAPDLVAAGVDAFHVSGGVIDRFVTGMVNGAHDPNGLNVAQARAIKNAVDVPVMVVGRIHTPEFAEEILQSGAADLIAMARPFLADPELPVKAQGGRSREIRRCISCQNCIDAMESRMAMDCAVNPRTGRELELPMAPVASPRDVVVVGAGPGGLEAARVAALRGHRVRLFEASGRLGGALVAASIVHAANAPFLDWLLDQVRSLPIAIHLNQKMDADSIVALNPDAVILALGGTLTSPPIPGVHRPNVLTGAMLRRALAGGSATHSADMPPWLRAGTRVSAALQAKWLPASVTQKLISPDRVRRASHAFLPIGERIAIVGADLAAIELAEFLAERRRRVQVFSPEDSIAPEVGGKRRGEHMDRLDRLGVAVNLGFSAEEVREEGLLVRRPDGTSRVVEVDQIVIAGEIEENPALYQELKDRVPACYAVGDATGLGLIQKAVLEGARASCSID